MMTINNSFELVDFFNHFKSPTRATIVSRTPVKMNKKDVATKQIANPFGEVFKVQTVVVDLNADYEQKVNDQRFIEGSAQTFEAEGRAWGKHINNAIVEKTGRLYLHCIEVNKMGCPRYETATGRDVDYNDLLPFIPVRSSNTKQQLAEEVKVRDFSLPNIIGLNIDGKARFVNV